MSCHKRSESNVFRQIKVISIVRRLKYSQYDNSFSKSFSIYSKVTTLPLLSILGLPLPLSTLPVFLVPINRRPI